MINKILIAANFKQILTKFNAISLEFKILIGISKQFFNDMFALMPPDMTKDEEVKKVLGSLKGKVK